MDIKQAFAELGLTQQADQAEAKAAYRTLAMRWHPDVNIGLETDARMQRINVAYALVCQHLDEQAATDASAPRPASGFAAFDWKTGFQRANRTPAPRREECVQRTLRVSMFEAAFGCVKRVSGMQQHDCPRCAGSGKSAGTWTMGSKCPQCFGQGLVKVHAEARATCGTCKGSGVVRATLPACDCCKGSGKAQRCAWTVDVTVHAGSPNGMLAQNSDIRVISGAEALPHRLELTLQIEKHPLFQLDQGRLSVSVPISVWQWVLGGEITVPTLDGSARIRLPNRPTVMLIKNQGWPQYKAPGERKPLFVMPKIIYPELLQAEERRMLELLDVRSQMPEVQGWSRHVQAWVESSEQDLG